MDEDLLDDESTAGSGHERPALESGEIVVFEVGRHVCGLRLERVREIVLMCELAQPPGLPPLLEGMLNLRGEITPVVRTDRLFNLPPILFRRYTQLVVLRGPTPLALLSERVRNVITLAAADLLPAPKNSVFNHCLAGVLPAAQGPIHVLDMERLLLVQEEQRISELQRIAQSRLAKLEEAKP